MPSWKSLEVVETKFSCVHLVGRSCRAKYSAWKAKFGSWDRAIVTCQLRLSHGHIFLFAMEPFNFKSLSREGNRDFSYAEL